jgi:hypothetical protein
MRDALGAPWKASYRIEEEEDEDWLINAASS